MEACYLGLIEWQAGYCCERFGGWIMGLVGSIVSIWEENGEEFMEVSWFSGIIWGMG